MTDQVDVCNLSLGFVGNEAKIDTINPPDDTNESIQCAKFFPIALQVLLEDMEADFSTVKELLTSLGSPPTGWLFKYQIPENFLSGVRVYPTGSESSEDYELAHDIAHGTVVLTNVEQAEMEYITYVDDPNNMTPNAILALAWLLASFIAMPITRDPKIADNAIKFYDRFLPKAVAKEKSNSKDGGPRVRFTDYVPRGIKAHGNDITKEGLGMVDE